MSEPEYFQPTYRDHRAQFLGLTEARGAHPTTHPIAARGPGNELLAIDAARLGAPDAARVLLLMSGIHGVEGYAGSAIQAQFLAEDLDELELPTDAAVLVVHAVNPFGFAWGRRVNENNVDLNRNFLDHAANDLRRPDYVAHDAVINPTQLHEDDDAWFLEQAHELIQAYGFARAQAIVSEGQYEKPLGVAYGGDREQESTRLLKQLVVEQLAGARECHLIDFHTGLGEHGRYTMLSDHPEDSPEHARLVEAYPEGRVECPRAGGSISAALTGESGAGLAATVPQVFFWGGGCEFGTVDPLRVFRALRRENWCWHHGPRDGPRREAIVAELLEAFRPDTPEWRARVLAGGREALRHGWAAAFRSS